MPTTVIKHDPSSAEYPAALRAEGSARRSRTLWTIGDTGILKRPLLGLFCSTACPDDAATAAHALVRALGEAAVPVISGFHSPLEKQCLNLLLLGRGPIVVCPARSIARMRIPPAWRPDVERGRLVIASAIGGQARRATTLLAAKRNALVATLATEILVIHAAAGGRIDALCRTLLAEHRTVWTLDLPENRAIAEAGAATVQSDELAWQWRMRVGDGCAR
jgi:predicted Rossmann fold nucleotide-binding protein DprA/Smf involved in DNA uptake